MRALALDEATQLYERPAVARRPPQQPARRLPKVPASVSPEQLYSIRVAQAALEQKPRRARYLFTLALLALMLLDGVAFSRMSGLWNPTEIVPQSSVPGIFVPLALRFLAYGPRKDAPSPAPVQTRTVPSASMRRPHR